MNLTGVGEAFKPLDVPPLGRVELVAWLQRSVHRQADTHGGARGEARGGGSGMATTTTITWAAAARVEFSVVSDGSGSGLGLGPPPSPLTPLLRILTPVGSGFR